MTSRVVVVAIFRKVQTRKVQEQERVKAKDKARTETVERVDESSWNEASQADASINKTVPQVWVSRS